MNGFLNLKDSRKAAAALAGIIVAVVLLATGQIDGDSAGQLITAMLMVLIGSIAYEDAAQKRSG